MAAKKTAATVPTAQDVFEGEELVTIRLPISKEEQGDVFVSVNERSWLIKRGEYVRIPKCAAKVLEHAEQAMMEDILFQQQNGIVGG